MADLYTSAQDEELIQDVLRHGLGVPGAPKWTVLRMALAKSLQLKTPPDEELDNLVTRGSEYHLEQLTGEGKPADQLGPLDFDDAMKALLSVYHSENLFGTENARRYRQLLQRHIRRGLREFRTGWRVGHDFHAFLYQELFTGLPAMRKAEERSDEVLRALREIGVTAEVRGSTPGPRITRYRVFLSDVNQLDRLRRGLDKLALSLNLQQYGVFLEQGNEAKTVSLDLPRLRETWAAVNGSQLRGWAERPLPTSMALPVWPGVDVLGAPFCFDLAKAPHLLVAGTTGSGKSICLNAIILSLLWRHRPNTLKLVLIDPKQVEFAPFGGFPHLHGGEVIVAREAAFEALQELIVEMEARNQQFKSLGVTNIQEALLKGHVFPFIVVVVEELADLLMQSREIEEPLVRLAQKARSSGIHLVLATQRPDAETFSGLLRSNIPARIALTVQKSSESRIIFDEVGAEKLLGQGDMLVKPEAGAAAVRVHGVHVIQDDVAACLRNTKGGK